MAIGRFMRRLGRVFSDAAYLLVYEDGKIEVVRGKLTGGTISEIESVLRAAKSTAGEISVAKNGRVGFSKGIPEAVHARVRNSLHER